MLTREEARRISLQSPEVIEDMLYTQSVTIESLQKQVQEQQSTIAQLSKNSSNSHKPPSSDDITKPNSKPKKKKKKGKRKIGGQPGHPKHERPPFTKDEIDTTYEYTVTHCPHCNGLVEPMDTQAPKVIQQVEIKEVPILIEEHISYPMWCEACQKVHYGSLPPEGRQRRSVKRADHGSRRVYETCLPFLIFNDSKIFPRHPKGQHMSQPTRQSHPKSQSVFADSL